MRRFLALTLIGLSIGLAGCGGGDGSIREPDVPTNVSEITLSQTVFVRDVPQELVITAKYKDGTEAQLDPDQVKWERLPDGLTVSSTGELLAERSGLFSAEIKYSGNSYPLHFRVGLSSERIYVPSNAYYREDMWLAFRDENVLRFLNTSYPDWTIPDSIQWNEDPYTNPNWQFLFQSMGWFRAMAYGYDQYNDSSGLEFVKREMFSWWGKNQAADKRNTMAWHDHATANRIAEWLYFYHHYFINSFSQEELATFEDIAKGHAETLAGYIDGGRWDGHNHSFFHALALYDISKTFEHMSDSSLWREKALSQLDTLYSSLVDIHEGVSLEQSSEYHFNAMFLFKEARRVVRGLGDNLVHFDDDSLLKMAEYGAFMKWPNNVAPPYGDTPYGYVARDWIINAIRDLGISSPELDFIMTQGKEGKRPPTLISYDRAGYYIVRPHFSESNWRADTHLLIDGAQQQRVHGNNDALSFMLYTQGHPFLVDSGAPFSYAAAGQAFRKAYFQHARAHNTVIFNGQDYSRSDTLKKWLASQQDGESLIVLQRGTRAGELHQRHILVLENEQVLIVDHTRAQKSTEVSSYWHLNPKSTNALKRLNSRDSLLTSAVSESDISITLLASEDTGCEIVSGREMGHPKGPMGWVTQKIETKTPSPTMECSAFMPGDGYIWQVVSISGLDETRPPSIVGYNANELTVQIGNETKTITLLN